MEALRALSLPLGFGFHPTDVELISYYLKKKVHGQNIEFDVIPEIDIYKHEPWDLPSKCNVPTSDMKWHFFTARDRKYPNGSRSNRATEAGYWKSTGRDRSIRLKNKTIGTKKTLVFHEGRPPTGKRTEWIMHEYYLDENECKNSPGLKDLFVICRVTKREGSSSEPDTRVPPEMVPDEKEKSNGPVEPITYDNLSNLSENIVSSNVTNDNNNHQQDDLEKWLQELFDPSICPPLDEQFNEVPAGHTPAALNPEPMSYSPVGGSEDENAFLFQVDIQSILGTSNYGNTHDLQFLEDDTAGINNEDDETGIVIRPRRTTAYDNPDDSEMLNKYNVKSKLQVHLYKKEEQSFGTANKTVNFVPKDGLVGEFENCEKIKHEDENILKSTEPKRAKRRGFIGTNPLIFGALMVVIIAILFYIASNTSVVAS